jgi:uncharacterized protein (TIGR00369 family)
MIEAKKLRALPNRENHSCFGCSPTNPCGLRMTFFTDGTSVFTELNVPEHTAGWKNLVHGGVISTILDEVMGWSAIFLLKRFVLTKSISVDFLKPAFVGGKVRAEGKILDYRNAREAVMESTLFDGDGNLCFRGTGTFAVFAPEAAMNRGIINEETLQDLERIFNA